MSVIDALMACGAALVFMLLFMWELFTRPGFLKSWLAWSLFIGFATFFALLRIGLTLWESLGAFVFAGIMVALGELRYRIPDMVSEARAARDAKYDAFGNPRPTSDAPKADDPPGA